ncbi:MAG: hypothetical protein HUJ80_08870 [Firmicutes bacterium]|nr:hypothetical protein [Bacillota bacterium]
MKKTTFFARDKNGPDPCEIKGSHSVEKISDPVEKCLISEEKRSFPVEKPCPGVESAERQRLHGSRRHAAVRFPLHSAPVQW